MQPGRRAPTGVVVDAGVPECDLGVVRRVIRHGIYLAQPSPESGSMIRYSRYINQPWSAEVQGDRRLNSLAS